MGAGECGDGGGGGEWRGTGVVLANWTDLLGVPSWLGSIRSQSANLRVPKATLEQTNGAI